MTCHSKLRDGVFHLSRKSLAPSHVWVYPSSTHFLSCIVWRPIWPVRWEVVSPHPTTHLWSSIILGIRVTSLSGTSVIRGRAAFTISQFWILTCPLNSRGLRRSAYSCNKMITKIIILRRASSNYGTFLPLSDHSEASWVPKLRLYLIGLRVASHQNGGNPTLWHADTSRVGSPSRWCRRLTALLRYFRYLQDGYSFRDHSERVGIF